MNEPILDFISSPTRYIDVKGINYAYRALGKPDGIPLVCLQHFTGTLDNWDPVIIDGLAKERSVILIDNKGVGNSSGETPDNVLEMSKDVLKVIHALGIKFCDLLGFSLGGFLAQTLLDLEPVLFRKVIIVGSAPQGAKALYSFPELVQKAFALTPKERYLFIFATKTDQSRAKIEAALGRLYQRTEDRDKSATMQAIGAQIKALTRWGTDPVTIDLAKISQPVLIVQGSNDEMMGSAGSMELYQQIRNSMLIYYPDSAHGSFLQYPELFVEQANSFLNTFD